MNKVYKAISSFLKLSFQKKISVFFILFSYLRVRTLLSIIPLDWYFNKYFGNKEVHKRELQLSDHELGLVRVVLNKLPCKSTCLIESMVVHLYFRRQNIYVPIQLGVKTGGILLAHAWYRPDYSQGYTMINKNSND